MSLVPSRPDPYNELAYLIMECDGRPIHSLPRHQILGGGTRLRFSIPSVAAARPIADLCRRHGWRFTQPSGVQMVVDIPIIPAMPRTASRQPSLEEGQRELPSG